MANDPLMRVGTSGTQATGKNYSNDPATAGLVLTSDGPDDVPKWEAATANVSPDMLAAVYAANWAVTDWYLDGTVGNDNNNGTAAATPLRTGAELLRRLGPYALWTQSVTVHVGANGMVDPLVLRGVLRAPSTHVDIVGTPTLLHDAGTVNTYVGIDHTIPRAPQVTLTGVADFTAFRWKRLRLTTTALAGAVTWVAAPNPGGAGVATARTQRWSQVNTVGTSSIFSLVNPVGGEGCVIESIPFVPSIDLLIDGLETTTAGVAQWPFRVLFIDAIDCPLLSIIGRFTTEFPRSLIFGSSLGTVCSSPNSTGTANGQNAVGCYFAYASPSSSVNRYHGMPATNACLFGNAYTFVQVVCPAFFQACLLQGCALTGNLRFAISGSDVQVFDMVGSTAIFGQGKLVLTNTSGSGNTGIGLSVSNNVALTLSGTYNVQGATTNVQLLAAPATNLTIPQALQPNDYAQKGTTPAMIGGTVTVTVPWYENTIQKVTATHATFGGTPGILSVQQISTTQFVVTSSNALDTSTVNWQISPLGRNILISTS